jgi:hypothetical protein
MGVKTKIIAAFAERTRSRLEKESKAARQNQKDTFQQLISKGTPTTFGKEHGFATIKSHKDFIAQVPLRDYEDLRPYIDQIIAGHSHVLWPGKPLYLAKTSGTTSGVKYIPITKDSIPNHIDNARDALFNMMTLLKLKTLFDGKMIFLSGSPVLEEKGGIPTGRLSGIVNHWIPNWLKGNQLPSFETNCIDDWETKVDQIARETLRQDMRLISGIPPWVQMYYTRLLELSGKNTIREIFPNYQLFVYGGVNFEPYRAQLEQLTGGPIHSLETYPASEGFIAFQDLVNADDGLALQCNSGIFYEFIPVEEISSSNPNRLSLSDVQFGKDYAVVINSNAGLWGYNLGDTVSFVSLDPYRLKVTGRVKHFISAFGEHVIAKEVEEALQNTMRKHPCALQEFTVAPQVNPPGGQKPFHEWWIEFGSVPLDVTAFARDLNDEMIKANIYYRDLLDGKILQPLQVRILPKGSFKAYMQSIGKLGGQNKVPRLSNDRSVASPLEVYLDLGPKPT